MNPHDTDPHRRNLSVLAFSFIVYYAAGGYFANDEVRIQVVNIKFNDPAILGVFAWGLLFWFLYRYWQTRRPRLRQIMIKEIEESNNQISIRWFIKNLPQHAEQKIKLIEVIELKFSARQIIYKLVHVTEEKNLVYGSMYSQEHVQQPTVVPITGKRSRVLTAMLFIRAALTKPGFLSWLMPYVLFYIALFLGVYSGDLLRVGKTLF